MFQLTVNIGSSSCARRTRGLLTQPPGRRRLRRHSGTGRPGRRNPQGVRGQVQIGRLGGERRQRETKHHETRRERESEAQVACRRCRVHRGYPQESLRQDPEKTSQRQGEGVPQEGRGEAVKWMRDSGVGYVYIPTKFCLECVDRGLEISKSLQCPTRF